MVRMTIICATWAGFNNLGVMRENTSFQMGNIDWFILSMTKVETATSGIGLEQKTWLSLYIVNLGLR